MRAQRTPLVTPPLPLSNKTTKQNANSLLLLRSQKPLYLLPCFLLWRLSLRDIFGEEAGLYRWTDFRVDRWKCTDGEAQSDSGHERDGDLCT